MRFFLSFLLMMLAFENSHAFPEREPYYCLDGSLYGPGGLNEWSGDSKTCENPERVLIGWNFACFMGTLYGRDGIKDWSGSSKTCGDAERVKISNSFACFNGYLIDRAGNKKWTGDTRYCGQHVIP